MSEENKDKEVTAEEKAPVEATPAEKAPEVKKEETPADEGTSVEVPAKFKKIVEEIESMSVIDLNELVKLFENKFGVSATAVAAGPAAGAGDGDEGSNLVSVELTDSGANKIAVIKAVKDALGLGLKEAKDMVDGVPTMLKTDLKKEEADELKGKMEAAGGKVTLK